MTTTEIYTVTGMTCAHCVGAVTEEITKLPGVQDVSIELNPGGPSPVTVTSAAALDPSAVRDAVDEAGYDLIGGAP